MSSEPIGTSNTQFEFVKKSELDSLIKRVDEAERYILKINTIRNIVGGTLGLLIAAGIFSSLQGWIEPFRKIDYDQITRNVMTELKVSDRAFFENPTRWFDSTKLPDISKTLQTEIDKAKSLLAEAEAKSNALSVRLMITEGTLKSAETNVQFLSKSITTLRNTIESLESKHEQLVFKIERQSQTAINLLNTIGRTVGETLFRDRLPMIAHAVADILHADEEFGAAIHARLMPRHSLIATLAGCPSGFVRIAKVNLRGQRQVQPNAAYEPSQHEVSLCQVGEVSVPAQAADGAGSAVPMRSGANPQ
jgi:hypothetical protein